MFFLIDNLGRRNLLIIGAAGGSACMWIIGGYISTKDTSAAAQAAAASQGLSSGGIAAIFFFYLWTAFYTPSWNGTPWVINSEMFDLNTRGLGQASASANNWFWVSFLHIYPPYPSKVLTNSLNPEFHHLPLHTANVQQHGPERVRSLLLLRQHDDSQHFLRLVSRSRDKIHPPRIHGSSL